MNRGNPGPMSPLRVRSLARNAAEVVMSLAVIVMFGGLLAVTDPDEGASGDLGFVSEAGAQPA